MSSDRPADGELHPIATEASTYFVQGGNKLSQENLEKLTVALEALADKDEFGYALASLVQVAQYLDRTLNAKEASNALLELALSQTYALEQLNKKQQAKKADADREKAKAFNKFTGTK